MDIVIAFQHGNTALHEASWKGFSQSVHYLCKSKANPYIKNRGGFAPLHLCCQNGHNETCRVSEDWASKRLRFISLHLASHLAH